MVNRREFFGAIAVVFTLLYLAIQIRSSSRVELARSQRETTDSFNRIIDNFWSNPVTAEVMARGMIDFKSLEPKEEAMFHGHCTQMVNHYYSAVVMNKNDLLDEPHLKHFPEI